MKIEVTTCLPFTEQPVVHLLEGGAIGLDDPSGALLVYLTDKPDDTSVLAAFNRNAWMSAKMLTGDVVEESEDPPAPAGEN